MSESAVCKACGHSLMFKHCKKPHWEHAVGGIYCKVKTKPVGAYGGHTKTVPETCGCNLPYPRLDGN